MYVVYVNHPNDKALVHSASCSRFTNRKADILATGYWSSAFDTNEAALSYAHATGKTRAERAKRCCDKQ